MAWSKIAHFFHVSLLVNLDQENVFCDILDRENVILGYKKNESW